MTKEDLKISNKNLSTENEALYYEIELHEKLLNEIKEKTGFMGDMWSATGEDTESGLYYQKALRRAYSRRSEILQLFKSNKAILVEGDDVMIIMNGYSRRIRTIENYMKGSIE